MGLTGCSELGLRKSSFHPQFCQSPSVSQGRSFTSSLGSFWQRDPQCQGSVETVWLNRIRISQASSCTRGRAPKATSPSLPLLQKALSRSSSAPFPSSFSKPRSLSQWRPAMGGQSGQSTTHPGHDHNLSLERELNLVWFLSP